MFVVVAALAIFFIREIYHKWIDHPMIISVSPTPTLITNIPFPAITVCNLNRVQKSAIEDLNASDNGIAHIMCMDTSQENKTLSYSTTWPEFKRVLLKVSEPCNELITSCKFGNDDSSCVENFHPVLTDVGLCCTFNLLHPDYLLQEKYRFDGFGI